MFKRTYAAVVLLAIIWAIGIPGQVFGSDQQGGSEMLLQVDREALIEYRAGAVRDSIRSRLREAKIGYTGLGFGGRVIQVRIREQGDVEKAKKVLTDLLDPVASGISELSLLVL